MADDDTPSSDEGSLCPQEDQNERNSAGGEDGLSDGEASRREEGTRQQETPEQETQDEEANIQLHKSTRLKSYITLGVASLINYDSGRKSGDTVGSSGVPSSDDQRMYAYALSVVSLVIAVAAFLAHLDRLTPLKKVWIAIFKPKSRIELALAIFLSAWWTVGVGINTSVTGLAGDSKGQDSFYYSAWVCLVTSLGLLDAWLIAGDESDGIKAFVTSWPHRAPAWLCILCVSLCNLIWYTDLWRNFDKLNDPEEQFIREYFEGISEALWQWMIGIIVVTFFAALAFVAVEIVRETKDGDVAAKGRPENIVEGLTFLFLVIAWIPTVMVATTPGGPASLIGNAYFFTWMMVIFVLEGMVWFVHDVRQNLHRVLKEKEEEYRNHQQAVYEEAVHQEQRAKMASISERSESEYYNADTF